MPFSQSSQISSIIQFFESHAPESILDVGVGMGQYGFLLRNNLELINMFVIEGSSGRQARKDEWRIKIDGIEGYNGYKTVVHDYVYNNMKWGDALTIVDSIPNGSYEAVLAVDILEHFDKNDGLVFLENLKRVSLKFCLVSTPKVFHEQIIEANPLENHRSFWTDKNLADSGFDHVLENQESWIAVNFR